MILIWQKYVWISDLNDEYISSQTVINQQILRKILFIESLLKTAKRKNIYRKLQLEVFTNPLHFKLKTPFTDETGFNRLTDR